MVALADIDDFKRINDRFSHAVGDEVLKTIAAPFRGALRDGDLAARVGGEEFAFIFPEADERGARAVCERLREEVAGHDWHALHPGLRVTLSVGLACDAGVENAERLLARGDARLYAAKCAGKNRVGSRGGALKPRKTAIALTAATEISCMALVTPRYCGLALRLARVTISSVKAVRVED